MNIYKNDGLITSGQIAKTRAKMTIAGDRLGCKPEELQQLKKELVNILIRYMTIEKDCCKITLNIHYETNRGIQDVKTIQIK